ncbi:Lrp/AsnC family transcriptional regulator [Ahrensia sp. R2A130]|uniref:Lrp/AsnC family transcriptional regulator n=1 Tax=Ahrensia sp. R2A130 TaxID=744979 RepID=UPI0001E0C354|nr:Lrp/AsnC ligand binding domain-containing protein [Ahrensia sp. R2A130]EFL89367.1 leucine-responsive regulatory protein [Ahrensia sp. R2A130]
MATEHKQLDNLDRKILAALSNNARISITDLADQIGLSKTPCSARVKRLEDDGIITGYRAVVDPVKLGLDHIAFVEVKLSDTRASALNAFGRAVQSLQEIEQCHMIAGGFDYLLKVRTRDITTYRHFLGETLSALPGVAQTSTYVAMEAVKDVALLE